MTRFAYTILYVEDVTRSLDFYARAFGLATRMCHEAGDYGELDTGSTTLAFSSTALMRQLGKHPVAARADAPCFEIALATDDVAAAMRRAVEAGARTVRAPERMPWGQTIAYVADPDGVLVELCTPIGGAS